jgi:nitrogenase molybdenum-iron protein alpha/beta subunit
MRLRPDGAGEGQTKLAGQPLGAILASLGLAQAIPLVHGAQGCSAFAKVFLIGLTASGFSLRIRSAMVFS